MKKNKIILSYNKAKDEWTIINIKDFSNPFVITFSNNSTIMEGYFNSSDHVKDTYNILKSQNEYSVSTTINTGSGTNTPLTNNKFNTKIYTGLSYKELTNYRYNNIYAFELLPGGKYRTLNVKTDIN